MATSRPRWHGAGDLTVPAVTTKPWAFCLYPGKIIGKQNTEKTYIETHGDDLETNFCSTSRLGRFEKLNCDQHLYK